MTRILWLAFALPAAALAQPAFEVASIRVHREPPSRIDITTSGARLIADAQTPLGLLMYAFDLTPDQIEYPRGVRFDETMYDIAAQAPESGRPPTRAEFRQMLQALLADRFNLRVHHEKKDAPVYALVIAKGGPKLREAPLVRSQREDSGKLTVAGN